MTKPLKPTWLAPYRMLRNWGEKAFMVVTIVVIGIGLSRLQFPATWPSGGLKSKTQPRWSGLDRGTQDSSRVAAANLHRSCGRPSGRIRSHQPIKN